MLERSLPLRTSAGMSLLKILGLSSSLGLASLSLSSANTTQLASSTANRQHRTCILLQQTRDYHSTIADDIASICWSRKQLSMANRQHRTCILLQQTRYNHSTIADDMQALAVATETSWGQSPPMSCTSSEDLRDWLISCWRRRRIEDVRVQTSTACSRTLSRPLAAGLQSKWDWVFPEREAFPTFFDWLQLGLTIKRLIFTEKYLEKRCPVLVKILIGCSQNH